MNVRASIAGAQSIGRCPKYEIVTHTLSDCGLIVPTSCHTKREKRLIPFLADIAMKLR